MDDTTKHKPRSWLVDEPKGTDYVVVLVPGEQYLTPYFWGPFTSRQEAHAWRRANCGDAMAETTTAGEILARY